MSHDLNETLIFVKVVEQGSFIAAAKSLGLPKTTVSRKVQELERARAAAAPDHPPPRPDRSRLDLPRALPAHRARAGRSRKRGEPVAVRPARLAALHRALFDRHHLDRPAAGPVPCAVSGNPPGHAHGQREAGPDCRRSGSGAAWAPCPIPTWSRASWAACARRCSPARPTSSAMVSRCIRKNCSSIASWRCASRITLAIHRASPGSWARTAANCVTSRSPADDRQRHVCA